MPTATRTGMTQDAINELIAKHVDEALKVYDAAKNPGTEAKIENEQQDDHFEGDVNTGNGNGNGNGNPNVNTGGVVPVARECTYQDFMKCQPLNFKGTEGVVGLIRWFEKMVFHISNYPEKYQVKYATCTLSNSALTWWNSHKRTIGTDVAFTMSWRELMKLMTEDTIRVANNLMDQKLKGYDVRNAENKIRLKFNQKYNRGQQPPFKRQNVGGQNVARAYTVGNNERMVYNGQLPLCNKCKFHHEGPCTMRSDCLKLKNQNNGNKTGNKSGIGEARGKAYVLGGGDADPDSNTVTGTFLLNNHYAYVLFDSGADRSFVSTTFSTLLDVIPFTLDTSYAVELADGRISKTNVILRGCTLGLLGH
ncbi:hypothetical protein Tco_0726640 [Tanacetum coccineum]|uniref:Reverse transcriptase domain-containing protein n=1 Tax=Tanacetum coccineum TaxID=301880 RepID=A0ABQ4YG42_9ASTR